MDCLHEKDASEGALEAKALTKCRPAATGIPAYLCSSLGGGTSLHRITYELYRWLYRDHL
jgi:hypothetical protein